MNSSETDSGASEGRQTLYLQWNRGPFGAGDLGWISSYILAAITFTDTLIGWDELPQNQPAVQTMHKHSGPSWAP